MKGRLFIISAPSGTGKTTISRLLRQRLPGLAVSVSTTSRFPRPGEREGEDYRFVSRRTFRKMLDAGRFAEWAEVYGNYYGTERKFLEEMLNRGTDVLLTIDTQGGLQIKRLFPDALLIGVLPPSLKEQERRIRSRGGISEEEVCRRLEESRRERKVLMEEYDIRMINRKLPATIARLVVLLSRSRRIGP